MPCCCWLPVVGNLASDGLARCACASGCGRCRRRGLPAPGGDGPGGRTSGRFSRGLAAGYDAPPIEGPGQPARLGSGLPAGPGDRARPGRPERWAPRRGCASRNWRLPTRPGSRTTWPALAGPRAAAHAQKGCGPPRPPRDATACARSPRAPCSRGLLDDGRSALALKRPDGSMVYWPMRAGAVERRFYPCARVGAACMNTGGPAWASCSVCRRGPRAMLASGPYAKVLLMGMIVLAVKSYNRSACRPGGSQFDEWGGTIGRADGNLMVMPDPSAPISRVHAKVVFRNGRYALEGPRQATRSRSNGNLVGHGKDWPLGARAGHHHDRRLRVSRCRAGDAPAHQRRPLRRCLRRSRCGAGRAAPASAADCGPRRSRSRCRDAPPRPPRAVRRSGRLPGTSRGGWNPSPRRRPRAAPSTASCLARSRPAPEIVPAEESIDDLFGLGDAPARAKQVWARTTTFLGSSSQRSRAWVVSASGSTTTGRGRSDRPLARRAGGRLPKPSCRRPAAAVPTARPGHGPAAAACRPSCSRKSPATGPRGPAGGWSIGTAVARARR